MIYMQYCVWRESKQTTKSTLANTNMRTTHNLVQVHFRTLHTTDSHVHCCRHLRPPRKYTTVPGHVQGIQHSRDGNGSYCSLSRKYASTPISRILCTRRRDLRVHGQSSAWSVPWIDGCIGSTQSEGTPSAT